MCAMDDVAIARAVHVLAVVLWMGGVAFVTTALLPSLRRSAHSPEWLASFDAIERRFAWQARVTTLLAGASGAYMLVRLDLWDRFLSASFWWMHAMVLVWLLFTLMLFVVEPLFLAHWLRKRVQVAPGAAFRLIERFHRWALLIGLVTIFGAVAGSHGFLFFG
jgi:uncharacterized membrane protein